MRSVLFNLLINDLELQVSSVMTKSGTKLFTVLKTKVDCKELQEVLHKLGEWVTMRQMKFSVGKVMHFGTKKILISTID